MGTVQLALHAEHAFITHLEVVPHTGYGTPIAHCTADSAPVDPIAADEQPVEAEAAHEGGERAHGADGRAEPSP